MISVEVDVCFDDTLEKTLVQIQDGYGLKTEVIAVPGIEMMRHGAWPIVRITGDFKNLTRWLADCYDCGDDGETFLEIMREAKVVIDV